MLLDTRVDAISDVRIYMHNIYVYACTIYMYKIYVYFYKISNVMNDAMPDVSTIHMIYVYIHIRFIYTHKFYVEIIFPTLWMMLYLTLGLFLIINSSSIKIIEIIWDMIIIEV